MTQPTIRPALAYATAGGQTPSPTSGPTLDMAPTLLVALIHGPTLVQPVVTLHTSRQHAIETLADWARVHLTDLLGYEPKALQGRPDLVAVQNELAGFTSLRADLQDVAVTL